METADMTQRKIMIAGGNSRYAGLIARILHLNSYQNVLSLTDPLKLVDAFRSAQPDLLLMDMEMPEISGFDILASLREEGKGGFLPVIVISEHADNAQRARVMALGAQDMIGKPFSQHDIVSSVARFFERSRRQSKKPPQTASSTENHDNKR